MSKKKLLPFTWIEYVIVLTLLLIFARFYWAQELYEFEQSLFVSLGISENYKYLVTVPLAALVFLDIYLREKRKAKGECVVRNRVLGFVAISTIFIIIYFSMWV